MGKEEVDGHYGTTIRPPLLFDVRQSVQRGGCAPSSFTLPIAIAIIGANYLLRAIFIIFVSRKIVLLDTNKNWVDPTPWQSLSER